MKKSTAVVAVVAALVVAYGATSWYIGKQAETKITLAVEKANDQLIKAFGPDITGDDLKMSILNYERGIFSSNVTYSLGLRNTDGDDIELLMQDDLQHGPFPMAALGAGVFKPLLAYSHSTLMPTDTLKPWFDAAAGKPLEVRTSIALGGDGESHWTFAPVELAQEDLTLYFSGAGMQLSFDDTWEQGTTSGGFAALEVKDDTGQLLIRDVLLEGDAKRNDDNVLQSESKVKIASIGVGGSALAAVDMKDIEVALSSEQQGDLVDGELSYKFGSVKAADMDLGSIGITASVARLDVKVMRELMALLEQDSYDESGFSDQTTEALSAKVVELLKTNPTVAISPLSWKNDAGESWLNLNADLQNPGTEIESELQYVSKADLDAKVSRDMFLRLFGQQGAAEFGGMLFDQYLARLQEAGIAAQDTGDVIIKASYADEKVTLNDQTMTVEELMQRAMLAAM